MFPHSDESPRNESELCHMTISGVSVCEVFLKHMHRHIHKRSEALKKLLILISHVLRR